MSVTNDIAIISFPFKLVAGEGEGTTGTPKPEEITEDVTQDIIDEISDEQKEALAALDDFLKTTDKQGLQTLSKFAKNPTGTVQNELLSILGKAGIQGALAVTIIGIIIASPQIIMAITKQLAVKGGPLNQDFHRFFEEENQLGLERNLQYRRSVGLDVIIMNDNRDYLLADPGFVTNSLVDVETTRSIRTSSNATEYGYVNGM